jgi:hypothetical protein
VLRSEPALGAFGEHADAGERSQQPVDAVFRCAGLAGDVSDRPCPLTELIGNAEFDDGGDRLADPLAGDHLEEGDVGRRCRGSFRSSLGHGSWCDAERSYTQAWCVAVRPHDGLMPPAQTVASPGKYDSLPG